MSEAWAVCLSLFGWSFAAATILPLSSEAALAGAVAVLDSVLVPVAVATVANVLGSVTTYWLGNRGAAALRRRVEEPGKWKRAEAIIRRYGAPAMLLAWVPIIGDVLVALAGATRMNFALFVVFTLIGKLGRYLLIAYGVSLFQTT